MKDFSEEESFWGRGGEVFRENQFDPELAAFGWGIIFGAHLHIGTYYLSGRALPGGIIFGVYLSVNCYVITFAGGILFEMYFIEE